MPKIEYHIDVFRVSRGKAVRFWSRIKARNHKILWHSEQINTKRSVLKPVMAFRDNVGKAKCKVKYFDKINKTSEVI